MPTVTKSAKRTRLNVRIPTDLVRWAKVWAKKKNTTITQVIVDYLTSKKEEANGEHSISR